LNGTVAIPHPEQEKPLGFIQKEAQELSELVNDILDLAKVEAGKMVVRCSIFSAAEVFGALRGMFRPLHRNEAVKLLFEDVEHLPPLHTDEVKLRQVLRNFISNALKFTERGEVRVTADLQGESVIFSISDTGIGISPADQALLFHDFAQIEGDKQPTLHGTGLGLALARELALLLEGDVAVTSEAGAGSVFSLTVPRVWQAAAAADPVPSRRGR
jgi:signal transduction histidine kinase